MRYIAVFAVLLGMLAFSGSQAFAQKSVIAPTEDKECQGCLSMKTPSGIDVKLMSSSQTKKVLGVAKTDAAVQVGQCMCQDLDGVANHSQGTAVLISCPANIILPGQAYNMLIPDRCFDMAQNGGPQEAISHDIVCGSPPGSLPGFIGTDGAILFSYYSAQCRPGSSCSVTSTAPVSTYHFPNGDPYDCPYINAAVCTRPPWPVVGPVSRPLAKLPK